MNKYTITYTVQGDSTPREKTISASDKMTAGSYMQRTTVGFNELISVQLKEEE